VASVSEPPPPAERPPPAAEPPPPTVEIALRRLSDAYATAVDARDLAALRACFLPDGRLVLLSGSRPPREYRGRAGLADVIDELAQFQLTQHHVCTCMVALANGGDDARGTVTGVAHHISRSAGRDAPDLVLQMRYEDAYRRDASGQWRFAERRARVLFSELRSVRLP
jgi:ketosteroid isomerase-like protein